MGSPGGSEQAAIKLDHAKETLLDAISSRHQDAVELMARSRVGLIAGSRKLQELQEERHQGRVQAVQDAIDRVVALGHAKPDMTAKCAEDQEERILAPMKRIG